MQKTLSTTIEGGACGSAGWGEPHKCGKAEGNTKINVAFPNVFVLFGVS